MRILSITAGAAGMYCGSCLRDNALAAELMAQGHDVTLVPVYTPTRTDEPNVSRPRVLFGGISVYLQQSLSFFRKTPALFDRLLDSPWLIDTFANRAVSTDARLLGDLTISMLRGRATACLRKEFDKLVDWIRERAAARRHQPAELAADRDGAAARARRSAGRSAARFKARSSFSNGLTTPYREQRDCAHPGAGARTSTVSSRSATTARVHVASSCRFLPHGSPSCRLGSALTGYDARPVDGAATDFRVGYFARIAPEKGLHVLADAYVRFRRRIGRRRALARGRLHGVGTRRRILTGVQRRARGPGSEASSTIAATVDRAGKLAFLRELDVLSVPATYDEPKGHVSARGDGAGVPVVQPRRGGFTEIVEKTGGGLLVEPDDAERLAEGLYAMWSDAEHAAEPRASVRIDGRARALHDRAVGAPSMLEAYRGVVARAPLSASVA